MHRSTSANRPRRSRLAAVTVAAGCAALALLSAGCGSSSVSNALDPVAQAATASTSTAGFRMNLNMQISTSALPSAITATGSGAFDVKDRTGSFNLAMALPNLPQITQALGSNTLTIQEVLNGQVIYVRLPDVLATKLPGGKPWIKVDLAKQGAARVPGLQSLSSSPFSNDPSQLLQYLRSISGSVTKVGTATVLGYQTTEYKATIDLSKAVDKLPSSNRAAARQAIQRLETLTHVSTLPIEVWIDNSHLVRKLAIQMNMTVANAGSVNMAMQVTIPAYGSQPRPTLPPASQVEDASALAGASSSSSTGL